MSEKVKQNFKPIKNLGRDQNGGLSYEPVEANGNKYHFLRPGDPLSIKKWTHYEKLKIVVGTGQTFAGIVEAFTKITDLAGADSYRKAILDFSRERYNKAFYLCTIFTYRENDDPYDWNESRAEQYIADWVAENMNEQDFFFFAMLLTPGFAKVLSELKEEADRQTEKLLVVTGSK